MAALVPDQIKQIVDKFLPEYMKDNPFVKALLAGAAAVGILMMTPAFAPIGVVGATGWIVVYIVTTGTFSYEVWKRAWGSWREMSDAKRTAMDAALAELKSARDAGAISDEEYREKARALLDKVLARSRAAKPQKKKSAA
jgi:hypothetical protein